MLPSKNDDLVRNIFCYTHSKCDDAKDYMWETPREPGETEERPMGETHR